MMPPHTHSLVNKPYRRRAKIVATLGPATANAESIAALIHAGVNVFRINGSHGDHPTHRQTITLIREQAARLHGIVGVLFDLQGPKIRVGEFTHPPMSVQKGDEIRFAVRRPPAANELPADYDLLDRDVAVGQPLLIDDGHITCKVTRVSEGLVVAQCKNPGMILPRKGINLPESQVSSPAITSKDERDIEFAAQMKVDFIALSFVRSAADIMLLKTMLQSHASDIPIIAKIEKPQALHALEEIVDASWGLMVARGDLGVELSNANVPIAQKRIIAMCNRKGKPVITATQMLDSMTHNLSPTRAEASDVANAVLDGSDAVMLSQETAVGEYPVETVKTMVNIIEATEQAQSYNLKQRRREENHELSGIPSAIAHAGCEVAYLLDAAAVVVYTETGRMALAVAQRRLHLPLIAFAHEATVAARLTLVWNVMAQLTERSHNIAERVKKLDAFLLQKHLARHSDPLVLLIGAANAPTGSTNVLMVHKVGDPRLLD